MSENVPTLEEREAAAIRLADTISGITRDWRRVDATGDPREVMPDHRTPEESVFAWRARDDAMKRRARILRDVRIACGLPATKA